MTISRQERSRLIPGLVLGILVAVLAGSVSAQPDTAAALPDSSGNLTGTILFIHGRPQAALPVPVADIRAVCTSRLEAALRGKGHRTLERSVLENLVMKWRIRGSQLIPREFLTDLHRDHGVGQILVATLLSDNGRFLMTTRMIDAETGRLTDVNLRDVDLPAEGLELAVGEVADWRWTINDLCLAITPSWNPAPPSTEPLTLILPMRGISSDPEITSAAAHSLLKTFLGRGINLLDPALVEVTMLNEGLPSHWLTARGRHLLKDRFGSDVVLVSELVSYDRNLSMAPPGIYDNDLPGLNRRTLTVFSMTLRAVDLDSGTAIRSAQIMHEKTPATGWFGTRIETTLLQELETTSLELWAAFSPEAEDD